MAQVPYSPTQTVAPTETGTQSYLNVSATPASFGGLIGAAEQHLGGTEEQAGEQLAQNAARIQDYNNKQDAQTADMAFQAKATQKYSAYSSLEGKAAVDAYPGFQKDLMATVDEIASTMKSPMAQQAFKTSAQFSANRMLLQSSVYAAQQQKRSWMETNKAQNEVLTQGGILQQNDPVTLLKNEGQIMTNAVGNLIHEDPAASQEQIDATKLSAAGGFWHAVITARMLTPTEQGGGAHAAQSLFNQVKERMDPRSILEVEQKLKPVLKDQEGDAIVGNAMRDLGYSSSGSGTGGGGASPQPGLKAAPADIHAAILGQESGNNPNVEDSVAGAKGRGQILQATFDQYAKPGEDIRNDKDNIAVSRRIIDDLSQRYDNDVARVAVGYFSGPGNVAPVGSSTPWKQDTSDKTGKFTSSYVTDVLKRVQGTAAAPPSFDTQHAPGMTKPGNVEVWNRPVLNNPDGSYSTTSSMSIGTDAGEVLIPTVIDGKRLSNDDAIKHFRETGENLGTFKDPGSADTYAEGLHNAQADYIAHRGTSSTSPGQGWRMPDWSKVEQNILDRTQGDSEGRSIALSKLAQTRSRIEMATATERANLGKQFEDLTKAAEAGLPVAVPEDRIRAVFPPDTADFYISRLNVAKGAGQILSGIKWATPPQVQEVAEGLRTGTGLVTDMIREKLGTQKGAATVTTPAGPGQPTPIIESPEQFGMRQQIAAKARQQIEERAKLLTADPAGYVLTEPSVAAAAQGMDAKTREDPTDPTSGSKGYAAFARSALAVQDHLGVPEGAQHVLTEHMAQDMVQSLMKPGADVKQELDALKSSWGDETWRKNIWPDLVTLGKMPTAYQGVVELTNDPKNAALLARAIQEQSKTGKEWDDLLGKTSSGKLVAQGIRDDIRGNPSIGVMEQSLVNSGATAAQADSMLHSIYTLGYAKKFYEQDGNPGQSAADAFTNRYQFYTSGHARIPRDRYDDVTANADVAVEGLNQQNIIIRPGFRVEGASPDARRGRTDPSAEDFVNSIKANPIWTTSPRGDALWLRDNQFNIVYGQDRKPISVPYSAKAPVNPAHLRYGDPMQYAPVGSNF